jgi:hydrogenase expression/formation protein HypD
VSLLSGPGCPVCVTPTGYLDQAIAIARQPGTVITTFGDMLRVPGTESALEKERATGADIRIVYSPMDALNMAKAEPSKAVVFLGVGFETTTPTIAWTIKAAAEQGVKNYYVLCAHKTIPEAMMALVSAGDVKLDGFLCPGHVSVITGSEAYKPVCAECGIPCVVAGFEAYDMARGIEMMAKQQLDGRAEVEVEYTRSVTAGGNVEAQKLCADVFDKSDTEWRGFGVIPQSGLSIADKYSDVDAAIKFQGLEVPETEDHSACRCGDVLRGLCLPVDCPMFGKGCTPSDPVGACMVSSEGSCAAYYKYGQ